MNVYKHFLPLIQLGFRVWIEKNAALCVLSQPDLVWLSALCKTFTDYINALMTTLFDWIWPNMDVAVEMAETHNFWQYERLLQMIHECLTWPCSNYLIQWCKSLQTGDEGATERVSKNLDSLLLLSASQPHSLVAQSLRSITHAFFSLSRPTYLEEMQNLDSQLFGLQTANFDKPQLSRPASDLSTTVRDLEDDLEPPQAETLSRIQLSETLAKFPNTSQESSLTWISLCSLKPSTSLPTIQFIIHDVLFGETLYHSPLSVPIQMLSNLRSTFNESITTFLANIVRAFLILEKQQIKGSLRWFRSRCGLVSVMPKILTTFLKFHESFSDLSPVPPPSFVTPPEQIVLSILGKLVTESEDILLRYGQLPNQAGDMGMNLSAQISLLPDVISALADSQLVSAHGLQLLMQLLPREDVRMMLDEATANDWIFSLPSAALPSPSNIALQADYSSLLDSLKVCTTYAEFRSTLSMVATSFIQGSPSLEQSALVLLHLLNSNCIESIEFEEYADSPGFAPTKCTELFELLSGQRVVEMLTMIIPLDNWVVSVLAVLFRTGEDLSGKSAKACEVAHLNFSAALLFLLQLLSVTRALHTPITKQRLFKHVQNFVAQYLPHTEGIEFENDAPQDSPNVGLVDFLYSLFNGKSVGCNTAQLEMLLACVMNVNDTTEFYAVSPWTWVNTIHSIMSVCIRYPAVKGANNERYDLVYPVLEALHNWTTRIPCLRPLILKFMLHEHLFGAEDLLQEAQNNWMGPMVEEILVRWIVLVDASPELSSLEMPPQGNMEKLSRIVCLSMCKEEIVKLLEKDTAIRASEWGRSLAKIVSEGVQLDTMGSTDRFEGKEIELKAESDSSPLSRPVVTSGLKIRFRQRQQASPASQLSPKASTPDMTPKSFTAAGESFPARQQQQLQVVWDTIFTQRNGDRSASETNWVTWLSSLQHRILSVHPHDIMTSAVHWILDRVKSWESEKIAERERPIKSRRPSFSSPSIVNGIMDVDQEQPASSTGFYDSPERKEEEIPILKSFALLKRQVEVLAYTLANIIPQQNNTSETRQMPDGRKINTGDTRESGADVPLFSSLLSQHRLVIFFFEQLLPTMLQRDGTHISEGSFHWIAYFSFLLINFSTPVVSYHSAQTHGIYSTGSSNAASSPSEVPSDQTRVAPETSASGTSHQPSSFGKHPSNSLSGQSTSSSTEEARDRALSIFSPADFALIRSVRRMFEMALVIASSVPTEGGNMDLSLRANFENWSERTNSQHKGPNEHYSASSASNATHGASNRGNKEQQLAARGVLSFSLLFLRLVVSSSPTLLLVFPDLYPAVLHLLVERNMHQCAIQASLPLLQNNLLHRLSSSVQRGDSVISSPQLELCMLLWKNLAAKNVLSTSSTSSISGPSAAADVDAIGMVTEDWNASDGRLQNDGDWMDSRVIEVMRF